MKSINLSKWQTIFKPTTDQGVTTLDQALEYLPHLKDD